MHASAQPRTVLVVDDDEGLLLLMEEALREAGYDVTTAKSGAVALNWIDDHSVDLMLLDLKLKDIAGPALLKRLKKANASLPFIVVTGQGDERVAVEMMKEGALDYLVKDTGMLDRLPAIVNRALERLARDHALATAQAALKQSEKQVLAISEREQRRFGEDLHDGLGQQLTAIELLCQSLKEDLRSKAPELEPQAEKVCQFLRETIAQSRSLARGLSPVRHEPDGLIDALGELANRTAALGRVDCRLECAPSVLVEDSTVSAHLFRISQEAVNNALKHAQADEIVIRLSRRNGALRLEISDNGKGLAQIKKPGQGIGLQVMKHRATVMGAALEVNSSPGKGVTVICILPRKD